MPRTKPTKIKFDKSNSKADEGPINEEVKNPDTQIKKISKYVVPKKESKRKKEKAPAKKNKDTGLIF